MMMGTRYQQQQQQLHQVPESSLVRTVTGSYLGDQAMRPSTTEMSSSDELQPAVMHVPYMHVHVPYMHVHACSYLYYLM